MKEEVTDALVRAIRALGRAEYETASNALDALANPDKATSSMRPRQLRLVRSRGE